MPLSKDLQGVIDHHESLRVNAKYNILQLGEFCESGDGKEYVSFFPGVSPLTLRSELQTQSSSLRGAFNMFM